MGNSAVLVPKSVCPWIGSMLECVLHEVSEIVRKFCIYHEGVGWKFVGGYFGFLLVVMFQRLLHDLFVELVKHVSSVIAREGAYSIEFSVGSQRRTLSVGFWEGKRFVCMPMLHCGRDVPSTKSYIDLVSQLLSAISGDEELSVVAGQMPIL